MKKVYIQHKQVSQIKTAQGQQNLESDVTTDPRLAHIYRQ